MGSRQQSLADLLIAEVDHGLRVVFGSGTARRSSPGADTGEPSLTESERDESAALMRVNHAGEVAAQALYRGQALTCRDPDLRAGLLAAADAEQDHLAWCAGRVRELGGRTSLLGPLWYGGSFLLGAVAGLAGRSAGLGFVVETERQVEEHLSGHLDRLPAGDFRSREIVTQIRADEEQHGRAARAAGGSELPEPVRQAMRGTARVMTSIAHRW
jgi:ubiquinone biosynthesis monooxygenase Coq7